MLFHPSGRAALAARHGRTLRPDEPLAERPLRGALRRTGWRPDTYDDPQHRFFALATSRAGWRRAARSLALWMTIHLGQIKMTALPSTSGPGAGPRRARDR